MYHEQVYRLNVDKGFEFRLKILIDLLFSTNSFMAQNGQLIVNLDIHNKKESISAKHTLQQLSHVKSVIEE